MSLICKSLEPSLGNGSHSFEERRCRLVGGSCVNHNINWNRLNEMSNLVGVANVANQGYDLVCGEGLGC